MWVDRVTTGSPQQASTLKRFSATSIRSTRPLVRPANSESNSNISSPTAPSLWLIDSTSTRRRVISNIFMGSSLGGGGAGRRGRETWSACSSLPDSAPSELRMTVDDPWNRLPIAGKLALPAVSAGGACRPLSSGSEANRNCVPEYCWLPRLYQEKLNLADSQVEVKARRPRRGTAFPPLTYFPKGL